MKLTEIIRKDSKIAEGYSQFFIAEKDFSANGIPILKDALVFYDGVSKVKINLIGFGIFQKRNVPELITHQLELDSDSNYMVEKSTTCGEEIYRLRSSGRGIWHNDHFDTFTGRLSVYKDRINNLPELDYNGIYFSPLFYEFDLIESRLYYFVTTSMIELRIHGKRIELPKLLEIDLSTENPLFISAEKDKNVTDSYL